MATLPWTTTTTPHPVADTVVLASRLELRAFADTARFLRAALRVRKTYWTLSAWTDQDALDAFVRTMPHLDVMARFRSRLTQATFTTWTVASVDLPSARSNAKDLWRAGRERLAATTRGANR